VEKNILATLVATSILTALSADASNLQKQCDTLAVHETTTFAGDILTCGQCNQPQQKQTVN